MRHRLIPIVALAVGLFVVSATAQVQIQSQSATEGMWLLRPADRETGERYGMMHVRGAVPDFARSTRSSIRPIGQAG